MQNARPGLVVVAFAAAVVIPCSSLPARSRPGRPGPSPPPSVLLITIDTLRADHLGCYGYARIKTPTIDRLASEGVRFENAYAQVPITLPSHAAILTGTYPMLNGVRDFTSPGLAANVPTLAEILRRNSYHTAAFVSSFVLNSMWGLNRGFEVYDDSVDFDAPQAKNLSLLERRGDRTVDRFLNWLKKRESKPFFTWLHLYDPHSPYRPPEPFRTRYSARPYDGEIAFDDFQVGRVVERLRELGLYENTFIALLSDHGESLGEHGEREHGFFVYNATLRVPLILKLPGKLTGPRFISQPVGTVDIAPTIAQVCRIPPPETTAFQGHSLLGVTAGVASGSDYAVYGESYYPRNSFGWHELRTIITPRVKFVDAPKAELYDLERDPGERVNLISENSAAAASLRERLGEFERRFGNSAAGSAVPLDPETVEKLRSLGYVAFGTGSSDDPKAGRADPKDKIATFNQILHASDLTRSGRFAEADGLLNRLEGEETDLYVLYFSRGENYLAWGQPEPAVEQFRKALNLNPTFDQSALGLGRAYFLLGRDAQAAEALELALRLNPNNFPARLALAKVYWREEHPTKAESELARVVEAHPDYSEARAVYGIILVKLGKYREGLAELRWGINLGYQGAIAYNYLGIAEAHSGNRREAVKAYENAVTLNPRYAAAYLNLALEYRQAGRPAKAEDYYKKVCELSTELCRQYAPQFPPASK